MLLVIDDDKAICASLSLILRRNGYEALSANDPDTALEIVKVQPLQLVLMDMNYSHSQNGEEGIMLLRKVKMYQPEVPVILMTAWGSIDLAISAMKEGAFDFITKPWNNTALLDRIETAIQLHGIENLKRNSGVLERKYEGEGSFGAPKKEMAPAQFDSRISKFNPDMEVIGSNEQFRQVMSTVEKVSRTNAPVLIVGESGCGKELVAEALHYNSLRERMPLIKVNLGGVSSSQFDSEMFGHKKGAFSDAYTDRKGYFEQAEGGTLFLDEIDELDLACQVKLLRVLQEQSYEVLGESGVRKANVRVVCATNVDLDQMVMKGTFREDLFYRINLITLRLPALRERKEDIVPIAMYFIKKQCEADGVPMVTVDEDAKAYLTSLPFYGNMRELKNMVDRTLLLRSSDILTKSDFETSAMLSQPMARPVAQTPTAHPDVVDDVPQPATSVSPSAPAQALTLDEMEKASILSAITECGGNLSKVAKLLGISRGALYRKLEKYDIPKR